MDAFGDRSRHTRKIPMEEVSDDELPFSEHERILKVFKNLQYVTVIPQGARRGARMLCQTLLLVPAPDDPMDPLNLLHRDGGRLLGLDALMRTVLEFPLEHRTVGVTRHCPQGEEGDEEDGPWRHARLGFVDGAVLLDAEEDSEIAVVGIEFFEEVLERLERISGSPI
jgi:hypothetical protein